MQVYEQKMKTSVFRMKLKKILKKFNGIFTFSSQILRYTNADWKSPYMFVFIEKQYLEKSILRILELFAREVYTFLKM